METQLNFTRAAVEEREKQLESQIQQITSLQDELEKVNAENMRLRGNHYSYTLGTGWRNRNMKCLLVAFNMHLNFFFTKALFSESIEVAEQLKEEREMLLDEKENFENEVKRLQLEIIIAQKVASEESAKASGKYNWEVQKSLDFMILAYYLIYIWSCS